MYYLYFTMVYQRLYSLLRPNMVQHTATLSVSSPNISNCHCSYLINSQQKNGYTNLCSA